MNTDKLFEEICREFEEAMRTAELLLCKFKSGPIDIPISDKDKPEITFTTSTPKEKTPDEYIEYKTIKQKGKKLF